MRRLLSVMLATLAMIVGSVAPAIMATSHVGAAEVYVDDRVQFAGDANAFYDIHWTKYRGTYPGDPFNGRVDLQIDLYSNSPRVYQGRIAAFMFYDWMSPQSFDPEYIFGNHIGFLSMCPAGMRVHYYQAPPLNMIHWNVPPGDTVGRFYGQLDYQTVIGPQGAALVYDSRVSLGPPNWNDGINGCFDISVD